MLTDKTIAQAKPKEKAYRLYDQYGLYLEVSPAGWKLWRLKYRFEGKEKRLAFGQYPLVSLKEARERTIDAKKLLEQGVDPSQKKKEIETVIPTFGVMAIEWWQKFMEPNKPAYSS